ncbi:ACR3 family arsenite efflux transporter [Streptomyces sp. NBC_01590]|uniref:ACR3 family arsenite efflux transporter n=1 Tax=Streptomyces sp. NBC_01590 TaxID=2975887 RepID=UPI002F90A6F6
MSEPTTPATGPVAGRLSSVDRFLAVWILAAMTAGLGLGRLVPGLDDALAKVTVTGVSLPIALGLLVMMYPVLAKVRYDRLGTVTRDKRLLISSLVINWVLGPAVMFALAWIFLPDLPEYRTGLIIVGLARCIAMVIIWNDLACGDREAAAVLVALNSVFQVLAFAALGWFCLSALPGLLGLEQTGLDVSAWEIARSVLIFLGIPLVAGFATRKLGERARGRAWYESRLIPRIGPFALYGLLFTIVVLFAFQGGTAFTAAGNNFELAIAVAIATFGASSGQALAGVVGPLIEVPVLIGLVHVALATRRFFPQPAGPTPSAVEEDGPARV